MTQKTLYDYIKADSSVDKNDCIDEEDYYDQVEEMAEGELPYLFDSEVEEVVDDLNTEMGVERLVIVESSGGDVECINIMDDDFNPILCIVPNRGELELCTAQGIDLEEDAEDIKRLVGDTSVVVNDDVESVLAHLAKQAKNYKIR